MQPAPAPTNPATAHFHEILRDLADLGHDLARGIHAQAKAGTLPAPEAAAAFERVARTVRRTILLAERLDSLRPPVPDAAAHRAALRRRILRKAEDAIGRTTRPRDAGALRAELLDRIDGPDIEYDIATCPLPEIVADIIHDLGLGSDPGIAYYQRRTPADIAQLLEHAARPQAPPARTPAPDAASLPALHLVPAPNTA